VVEFRYHHRIPDFEALTPSFETLPHERNVALSKAKAAGTESKERGIAECDKVFYRV
jgi:hypothetical protein